MDKKESNIDYNTITGYQIANDDFISVDKIYPVTIEPIEKKKKKKRFFIIITVIVFLLGIVMGTLSIYNSAKEITYFRVSLAGAEYEYENGNLSFETFQGWGMLPGPYHENASVTKKISETEIEDLKKYIEKSLVLFSNELLMPEPMPDRPRVCFECEFDNGKSIFFSTYPGWIGSRPIENLFDMIEEHFKYKTEWLDNQRKINQEKMQEMLQEDIEFE